MSLLSMLIELVEADVQFVMIGGFAAVAHGATIVTEDLDICYDRSPENLEALARILDSWGAYMRGAPPGLPFFMDVRTLKNTPVLTLRTRQGDIDIMDRVEGVGEYEQCLAASEWVSVPPVRVRVLNLEALIAAKKATRRPKDVERLRELEVLRERRQREADR